MRIILIIVIFLSIFVTAGAVDQSRPLPVLDCHEQRVQAGVPVKRLSDGEIVKIDVCGAADSADDTFRWKGNE